ncbi:MAG: hypothetical protein FWG69_05155, partial [Oscillospiraceae bacterium]|nr:hypothetical protein [Oscillospiraceae bacterium]
FSSQFNFCSSKSMSDFGIFIDAGVVTTIKTTSRGGMPLLRQFERKLESAVNRNDYKKEHPDKFGELSNLSPLRRMYFIELIKHSGFTLEGIRVRIKTGNNKIRRIMDDCLSRMGCEQSGELYLHISDNGENLSVYSESTGYADSDKILSLGCLALFQKGMDAAVPYDAPRSIEKIAQRYGQNVLRYYKCPCGDIDAKARKLALVQPFLRDGLMLSVLLLSFLKENKLTFADALSLLPEFSTSTHTVQIQSSAADIMRKLNAAEGGQIRDGLNISCKRGNVLLRPEKTGTGIILICESAKAETARELGIFFEKKIREQDHSGMSN